MLRAALIAIGAFAFLTAILAAGAASPGDFLLSAALVALIQRNLRLKGL